MGSARLVPRPPGRSAAHAYLAAFLPTPVCDEALASISSALDEGGATALAAAHRVLADHVRVADDAAAFTLVTEGGSSIRGAARITGLPARHVRRMLRATTTPPRPRPRRPRPTTSPGGGTHRQFRDAILVPAAAVGIGLLGLAALPNGATATGPVALIQDADRNVVVSVVTDVEPEEVLPGGDLDVTVAVMNGGTAAARGVVIVSQLPDELSYVDGSSTVEVHGTDDGGGPRRSVGPPTAGIDLGVLEAGATAELAYGATVDPGAPDGGRLAVLSSAQVEGFGRISSSPAVATVVRRAELEVALTSEPGARVPAGQPITWQVRVRNVGTEAARDVRVHWHPAVQEAITDLGGLGVGEERRVDVTAPAPASAGRSLRQQVEVVHADGPAVGSETIVIEVVGAHLADTGAPLAPAGAAGGGLLAVGWALLRRSGRRA